MHKEVFEVDVNKWEEIHSLPGSWAPEELRAVLAEAEYEDPVDDGDLEDMTQMVLQDLGMREASDVVLRHVFGNRMGSGVRQNLISELEEDRPWEQFADVEKQTDIFRAVTLLQKAFPNLLGTPDAIRMHITIRPRKAEAGAWLRENPDPGLITRLLAGGMAEDAVLKRLYEDELAGKQFPAATHILWQTRVLAREEASTQLEIISSHQWLDALQHARQWQCTAWQDE